VRADTTPDPFFHPLIEANLPRLWVTAELQRHSRSTFSHPCSIDNWSPLVILLELFQPGQLGLIVEGDRRLCSRNSL